VNTFLKAYRLNTLAIPRYISSGLCDYNNKAFRFLVMHRYARDLQHILNECNHYLPESAILYMTSQILYALEYIHSKGYAHGDIKGANLMLKNDKEVYLVDYGLASRFSRGGSHQSYTEKPERRHNGTIEYTSRDAHNGACMANFLGWF
jgi:vaccinia related kinase